MAEPAGVVQANAVASRSGGALSGNARSVDIIIPVHDAFDSVRDCFNAVVASVDDDRDGIIVVDDGSSSPTREYCEEFAHRRRNVRLVRRPQPSGFTRAANAGLRESAADYQILLNSDTIVPPGWIGKLLRCGQSAPDVGLVGPLSNAASWQSIPCVRDPGGGLAVNRLPEGIDLDRMDALCEAWSQDLPYPRVPLLNGFCLAIRKEVKTAIGVLDEANFPFGYGEENEYCLRAGDAGFGLLVAIDTYVYHAKSKSYANDRRRVLRKQGSTTLRALHGIQRVQRAVRSVEGHPVLARMRERASGCYDGVKTAF